MILLIPDALSNKKALLNQLKLRETSNRLFEVSLENSIAALNNESGINPAEVDDLTKSLNGFKPEAYQTIHSADLKDALSNFWENHVDPFDHQQKSSTVLGARGRVHDGSETITVRYSLPHREGWLIAMSNDFMKAIQNIDRKLQGRILEALAEISKNPTTVMGDTIKPLSRELNGLWRYRLGDYRLVYQPLPEMNQILLVNFASRGSVYG